MVEKKKVGAEKFPKGKLFDMDKQEWRELKPTLHQHWRSTKVYQCVICHVKINDWVLGGAYWGIGPKLICPGDSYQEHDELERLYKEYLKIETKIKDYKQVQEEKASIKTLVKMLAAEKDAIEIRMTELRDIFKNLHNVAGTTEGTKDYCPSARVGSEKKRLK